MKRVMVAAAVVVAAVVCGSALASSDVHVKEFAQGALTTFSDCPFAEGAPMPLPVCTDYRVWYGRFDVAFDGGPTNRAKEPFIALVEIFKFDPVAEELLSYQRAETTAVVGSWDKTALTSASIVSAAPMPLIDFNLVTGEPTPTGSTVTIGQITWTATTDVMVFGNDGPEFAGLGHVGGRCETANFQAHQKFRIADVVGSPPSINGVPVSAPYMQENEGAIFNNWFHVMHVTKNCA